MWCVPPCRHPPSSGNCARLCWPTGLQTAPGFRTPTSLGYRTPADTTLWPKENLINLARANLVQATDGYLAWVDADITFTNPNWVTDTMNVLDSRPGFSQLFQRAEMLSADGIPFQTVKSFAAQLAAGRSLRTDCVLPNNAEEYWHPGFGTSSRTGCRACLRVLRKSSHVRCVTVSVGAWVCVSVCTCVHVYVCTCV